MEETEKDSVAAETEARSETRLPATFPEAVMLHPKIYTSNGNFAEVAAFLKGYYIGLARWKPTHPAVFAWWEFEEYLDRLHGEAGGRGFERLGELHSAGAAVPELLALFRQYFAGRPEWRMYLE